MESTLDDKAEREEITRIIDLTSRYMADGRWHDLNDMLMQVDYDTVPFTTIISWLRSTYSGSAFLPKYQCAMGRAMVAIKKRKLDLNALHGIPMPVNFQRLWLRHG